MVRRGGVRALSDRSRLAIAILGTRGVPPRYGGFETFAAELSTRLAARGHDLTVYCRRSLYAGEPALWNGVRRVELPAARHKYFETVSHAFLSSVDALGRSFDVVLLCNAANAFVLPVLGAGRIPVAINVDGIERQRRKWNLLGRAVYYAGEALSATLADAVVADAAVIADYYRRRHAVAPEMIPYGSEFPAEGDTDVLGRLGLHDSRYILYVSRFEPENNPLEVVQAYRKVDSELPLVMVGGAPYSQELIAEVRRAADERVLLPGPLYGPDYRTLQRRAFLYVQATEVGGTHPAMIEAMASNGAILAHDTPENREVGGAAVRYFRLRPEETLSKCLQECIDAPAATDVYRTDARARARDHYGWERVVDAYEALFRRLAAGG
jgi:glycosyltransferase involved in cell wall biosynthesis